MPMKFPLGLFQNEENLEEGAMEIFILKRYPFSSDYCASDSRRPDVFLERLSYSRTVVVNLLQLS